MPMKKVPNRRPGGKVNTLPKLNPHEWKSLHDVLLRPGGSGPESKNSAWRSAKNRTANRLQAIRDNDFLDFEACGKLKETFTVSQLARFGILHLVRRAFPDPTSAPNVPSTDGSTSHVQQQQPSTSGGGRVFPHTSNSEVYDDAAAGNQHHEHAAPVSSDEAALPPQQDDEEPAPESAGGVPSPSAARLNALYDISDAVNKTKGKGDFAKVLAQLMVKHNLSVACVTDFLHTIHRKRLQIDLDKLPRDAKSLTKLPNDMLNYTPFTVADISETVSRGETAFEKARRVRRNDMARERAEATGGDPIMPLLDDPVVHEKVQKRHYMHLGVEDVCTLRSPGAVYRKDLIRVLKMAAKVCPKIVSMQLLSLIDPQKHEKATNDPVYRASLELCEETIFWMDLNIDGITLFKSSKAPQGIPILCRLYGLGFDPNALEPAIVIPTDMGYVSLIGMYHGVDKPDLEKFVDPLLVELRQLHPHMPKMVKRPGSKTYKREVGVMVRAMICDAKERPWLKGTGSHNSYQGCERCVCDGVYIARPMRFLCMNARKRRLPDWDAYLNPSETSIAAAEADPLNKKPHKHRTKDSPFNKRPRPLNMLQGFPIDDMHNNGGGAALTAVACVFGVDHKLAGGPTVPKEVLSLVEAYTQAWVKPKEIGRDPFPIRNMKKVKMRVAHNYAIYMLIPLLSVDEIREAIQDVPRFKEMCDVADLLMCFVVALHLICMTRHDSPSDEDIIFAEECLNSYVRGMLWVFGIRFLNYKDHCLIHLAAEAKFLKSHMGGFNAFPFENFLGLLRRIYVRSGKNVLKQVYNKLAKKAYYGSLNESPTDGSPLGEVDVEDDVWEKLVEEHGSLEFPQWTVLDSSTKYVTCRGFELKLKYPNNIALLRKPSNNNNNNEDVIAVLIVAFHRTSDGILQLKGREFINLASAHSTWHRQYHPLDLKKLGCYEANEGVEQTVKTWDFSDVRGKCFPFHLNLKVDKNPINYQHGPLAPGKFQRWILMRLKHTCNAETLTARDVPREPVYRKEWPNPRRCKCMTKWDGRTTIGEPEHDLSPHYFNFESQL